MVIPKKILAKIEDCLCSIFWNHENAVVNT